MKNNNIYYLILIVVFTLISACSNNDTKQSMGYLSFIVTYESKNEEGQEKFLSDIYKYELETDQATLITTIPYEKDYPVGVYLEKRNVVIYSGISQNISGNQVWMKNPETNETTMLTHDFYYLAHLQPISENLILIGGVLKYSEDIAINLFILNIDSHELTKLEFNDDIDVRNLTYDSETQSVLFTGYSHTDLRKNIEAQDTVPFKMVDNYIYEYKDGFVTELLKENENEILSVYRDKNQLQYRTINRGHLCVDISSKESCNPLKVYLSNPYFDSRYERIYYIDEENINVYDKKTNKEMIVFKSDKSISTINNMFYVEREYDHE